MSNDTFKFDQVRQAFNYAIQSTASLGLVVGKLNRVFGEVGRLMLKRGDVRRNLTNGGNLVELVLAYDAPNEEGLLLNAWHTTDLLTGETLVLPADKIGMETFNAMESLAWVRMRS